METLIFLDPNVDISTKTRVSMRHIHLGGYMVDHQSMNASSTEKDLTDRQAVAIPVPVADLRTLYQRANANFRKRTGKFRASQSLCSPTGTVANTSSSTRQLKPIIKLIVPKNHPFRPDLIQSIKERMSPESSLFLVSKSLGVFEYWNETAFPDPKSRPYYFRAFMR